MDVLEKLSAQMSVTPDGCFEWCGYDNGVGYGLVYHDGKNRLTHRLAYSEFVGEIPHGYDIDHLCRNTRCFNPDHLEAVTHRENVLRGVGWSATRAAQTHCLRDHEFSVANTAYKANGTRRCRACAAAHEKRYRANRRSVST